MLCINLKLKPITIFFPGIMQLRGADFYFIKMAVKIDHAAPFEYMRVGLRTR
jgi:hypothetical protein